MELESLSHSPTGYYLTHPVCLISWDRPGYSTALSSQPALMCLSLPMTNEWLLKTRSFPLEGAHWNHWGSAVKKE